MTAWSGGWRHALRMALGGSIIAAALAGSCQAWAAQDGLHEATDAANVQRMAEAYSDKEIVDLQAILDDAEPGSIVLLRPGTYRGPAVIRKPLQLRSERSGEAIVINDAEASALTIEADDVTLSGLHIRDEAFKLQPSVAVAGKRAVLEDLVIRTGADGIAARDADDGTVRGTEIAWAPEGTAMANKGNGIDLYNAHRWRLEGNRIRNVHDGIYMESSDNALVLDNMLEGSRYGVHGMYTTGTVIRGNEGRFNVTGAMVMTARGVQVTENRFAKQSENVHSQGILLYDAHDSLFADNTVEGNRTGFYVEQSTGNRLERNRIIYNFIGLQLLDAEGNTLEGNLFQGNVADSQARGSRNNELSGNYWDGFRGIDPDGDGFSDTAYAINPFFAGLTQKRAAFQLFFQSPGMVFLEELYQSDREQWTTDMSPLMAPPGDGRLDEQPDRRLLTGSVGMGMLIMSMWILYQSRRKRN